MDGSTKRQNESTFTLKCVRAKVIYVYGKGSLVTQRLKVVDSNQ